MVVPGMHTECAVIKSRTLTSTSFFTQTLTFLCLLNAIFLSSSHLSRLTSSPHANPFPETLHEVEWDYLDFDRLNVRSLDTRKGDPPGTAAG